MFHLACPVFILPSSPTRTSRQPPAGICLIYSITIYAFSSWPSCSVCASKKINPPHLLPSLFINKTSAAIDEFHGYESLRVWPEDVQPGVESRATQRVLRDWRGKSMFQPMTGKLLNMAHSLGGPADAVKNNNNKKNKK